MSTVTLPAPLKLASWRTPVVLIAAGCAIALLASGRARRSASSFRRCRSTTAGAARRSRWRSRYRICSGARGSHSPGRRRPFGPVRVLSVGAILYATGLPDGHATSHVDSICRPAC